MFHKLNIPFTNADSLAFEVYSEDYYCIIMQVYRPSRLNQNLFLEQFRALLSKLNNNI